MEFLRTCARYSGCLAKALLLGSARRFRLASFAALLASSLDFLQGTSEKIHFQGLLGKQPLGYSDVPLPPLAQALRALRATCRGLLHSPPVLAPTHQRFRTSSSAPRPFAEISGSISSSSRCFLSRKLCPILCVTSRVHSTGSGGCGNAAWPRATVRAKTAAHRLAEFTLADSQF